MTSEDLLLLALNGAVGIVGHFLRRLIKTVDALDKRTLKIETILRTDTEFARKLKKAA